MEKNGILLFKSLSFCCQSTNIHTAEVLWKTNMLVQISLLPPFSLVISTRREGSELTAGSLEVT
jgi:hypothetical protein